RRTLIASGRGRKWFRPPPRKPHTKDAMKRKLTLEALEDRSLMAAGLTPVPVSVAPAATHAPAQETIVSPLRTIVLAPAGQAGLTAARSYDWVSGLRINHNQTLVRDTGRQVRRKKHARRG